MTAQPTLLLATNHLHGWTGSETLLLTIARSLREQGCKLTVYARHLDLGWATEQLGPDILLIDNLKDVQTCRFDLAHVQHSSCLMDVRTTFPHLPVVFSSLGTLPFLEQPAPFDCGIARYLAISEEVRDNLVARGVPTERIEIVRNLVSERRFAPTEPIRSRPERILVLSYRMDEARKAVLQAAARVIGASIRFVGCEYDTLSQDQLAVAINEADVVVSLGRGVIETMLCGRVPLVFDIHGGDGLVTPGNLDELRTCNFSGRYHRCECTISDLISELGKYRQDYGEELRKRAIEQFGLATNLPRLLDIYVAVATSEVTLSDVQQETIVFCSSLAREDAQQSERYRQMTADLRNEILRLKRTVSWRFTAPLRVIWNVLRLKQHDR